MSFTFKFFTVVTVVAGCAYLLSREESTIGVNLHGVNHSAETFSFYLKDPGNLETISGGSGLIDPFGASGISCCAVLPRVWTPGLKLQIHTRHWLNELPDGTLPEIKNVIEADVPEYINGTPGELWVLRKADGKVEVVASNYQPDHPKWPGSIKGWPLPSKEYQRERWELHRKSASDDVKVYVELLQILEKDPEIHSQEAWDFQKKYQPDFLAEFSGPDDLLYQAALKASYEQGLQRTRKRLSQWLEAKP